MSQNRGLGRERQKKTERNRRQTPAEAKRQTDRLRKFILKITDSERLRKKYIKGEDQ